MMDEVVTGITVGRNQHRTAIVVYANDVTIFLTSPREIRAIQVLETYEKASGAKINITKSKAMALGVWDTSANIINMPYCEEVVILGVRFTICMDQAAGMNWDMLVTKVKRQATEAYIRNLEMGQRVRYINTYLLARVWNMAQILPRPASWEHQLSMAITWYLWKGAIFRVPLSTIRRHKREAGTS
jgi:hypothetical protein